jgi:hypothetical protein
MMKRFYAGFLCAAILCMAGCAKDGSYPSISAISMAWLELKQYATNTVLTPDLDGRIEGFRRTLNEFSSSPIGLLYRIYRPEYVQFLADIDTAAGRLNTALKKGGNQEFLLTMLEIDTSIGQLQLIDKNLSDTSQLNYFFLFFFFSLFIIATVLVL